MIYTNKIQTLLRSSIRLGIEKGFINPRPKGNEEIDGSIINELEKLKNIKGLYSRELKCIYLYYKPTPETEREFYTLEFIEIKAGDHHLLFLSPDDVNANYDGRPARAGMTIEESHRENVRVACEHIRNWLNVRCL